TIRGNYSFDDTQVLKAPNAFNSVELPGNHLLRRPVNSGSLLFSASYQAIAFSLTGYFTGVRTDSDFLGFNLTRSPGYARLDAAASYSLTHGHQFFRQAISRRHRLPGPRPRRPHRPQLPLPRPQLAVMSERRGVIQRQRGNQPLTWST